MKVPNVKAVFQDEGKFYAQCGLCNENRVLSTFDYMTRGENPSINTYEMARLNKRKPVL